MKVTTSVVQWTFAQNNRKWDIWAGIAAMSYVFAFRIPSEVFKQWGQLHSGRRAVFKLSTRADGIHDVMYGPYMRKGRFHATTSVR
eukprot:9946795-Karenia_brevis.AAC.1